ncbi:transglutaminase domain-containing protein [Candidatus Pacearchaeota archaeon]|nr:transglutaminase domain-containing protein [Candidatus Pacearchaeota archaeon]
MNTSSFKLSFEFLDKRPKEAWLALPINDNSQKIKGIQFSKRPSNVVKSKLYSYTYYKDLSSDINFSFILKTRIYSSYKDNSDISKYLKDNDWVQLELTKNIAEKLKTPKNVFNWVITNISFPKDLSRYLKDLNAIEKVEDILKNKEAECTGKSLLFVSLCRNINIPARMVHGYFAEQGNINLRHAQVGKDSLQLHTWAEFYNKGKWIPVDCQLSQDTKNIYFGYMHEPRIVISKDMNFKLLNNSEIIQIWQIGETNPKSINTRIILSKL